MPGLSDLGLYQRTLLIFHGEWSNVKQGEKNSSQVARKEPLVTVALDLTQGLWVARGSNWQLARSRFLGAVSGSASTSHASVILSAPMGDVEIFQYFSNDAPRRDGAAFRGTVPAANGATRYAQRTHWWRYDDPSIMTPFDRMAEMLDRAVRSPKLKARIREQFGGLISPEVLLPLAGTFLCMFGTEFVGGLVAVRWLAGLLGVNQLLCDGYFYEPRAEALNRICMGAASVSDLDYGAELIGDILCQVIADIGMAVGVSALSAVAKNLFSALIAAAPESVRLALRENAHVAAAYIRGKAYKRMDLLQDAHGTPLEPAAEKMYKESCEREREVLVVREPDAQRLAWVSGDMPNNAKPCMVKARSPDGWHGLVCLKRSDVTGSLKRSAGSFDTQKLRGYNKHFDAEHMPARLPMYDMPMDGRDLGSGIDYHYTGKDHIELKGHKLVDLGDRMLVVDSQGRPYIADLDLATRQRPGLSKAGAHLPGKGEDSPVLECKLNESYHKHGGNRSHFPAQHGGRTASVGYNEFNLAAGEVPGKNGFWGPQADTPSGYKTERLVIFLPEAVGNRIVAKMYAFEGWAQFKMFFEANHMQFGFKSFAEVRAMSR